MKKQAGSAKTPVVPIAVGSLLRLADAELKDAGLLSSGRYPGNVSALVRLAFSRLALAVIATEQGWPLPAENSDWSLVPDASPLKAPLGKVAKMQAALPAVPGVLPDGSPTPLPDREGLRAAITATAALLKDLASRFDVDLFSTGPAGRASPLRPDPTPPPAPKPALLAREVPPRKPFVVAQTARPVPPETHEVAGRSPIELAAASNSTASPPFWALMDRWDVGDLDALALVGHKGGLTKKGTRPRFKLVDEEAVMLRGLREIESALVSLQLDPKAWLHTPIAAAPFGGATPLAYLTGRRSPGVRDTIRFILQQGLKRSMSG